MTKVAYSNNTLFEGNAKPLLLNRDNMEGKLYRYNPIIGHNTSTTFKEDLEGNKRKSESLKIWAGKISHNRVFGIFHHRHPLLFVSFLDLHNFILW